ncbi:hypothetical protein AKJ36_03265 [candidate division MSBL1 archaeon SCGC-AAA259I07]|uniref:Uncharacterized protein n=1 Tax=candidate division MSBL1 archaeon SCGC-AAA259I07 TaxID=1698266 RepID=A0A133UJ70_9EURY|nr:hypothetical protein AKJ36_03265 [candidate division MSBL1 archaeon SCGC-AAA259I07]
MIFNGFHERELSLELGIYLLYEAKKSAEIAPGVGSEFTDIWVVSKNNYKKIDEDTIEIFEKARKEKMKKNNEALSETFQKIEEAE